MSELPTNDARADVGLLQGGFLFNVNLVFVSTVLSYGIALLGVVVIARTLGPEGRGVTSLYQSAVNVVFALLSFGVGVATVYFVARREMRPRDAMEVGLSVTLVSTAITAVGVLVTFLLFDDELAARHVPYWLTLLAVPAVMQFYMTESLLRAQGRFGAMNGLHLLVPLSLLGSLLALDFTVGLTVARTVYVWTLVFLPATVVGYGLIGRDAWPRRLAPLRVLVPALRFGTQGQLSNLIQLLNYRLDSYLVLLLIDASGVGLYAVGVSLSEGMWFIANSVAVVLLTNLTAGDASYASRMAPVACRNTLLVTGLAALAGGAISPVVIPLLFGDAFDGAVLPFLWLLPGTVALAGTKILAAYVFSRGKPLINAAIALVALAVTIGADLILIPIFGVPGAAAGASLAYVVSLVLTALAYRRLSGGSISEALLPRTADLALYLDVARTVLQRLPGRRVQASLPGEGRGRP